MAFKSNIAAGISVLATPTTVSQTVAAGTTHTIIGLSMANISTASVTVSLKINKSGGGSAFAIKDASIDPGCALVVVGADQKVVLETGDTLTAYCSVAASVDVIVSYLA